MLLGVSAQATEFIPLRDRHDLRPLYNAANGLYGAATGCEVGQDCICLHKDKVGHFLERTLKLHIGHPELVDVFILDEQGALKSEKGQGVLVSMEDLDAVQRHLHQCEHPAEVPAENEAQAMLRALHAVESGYYLEHHEYAVVPSVGYSGNCRVPPGLGFALEGCEDGTVHYTYSVRQVTKRGEPMGFLAEARSAKGADNPVSPGCAIEDVWTMDQDQKLTHTINAAERCPKSGEKLPEKPPVRKKPRVKLRAAKQ